MADFERQVEELSGRVSSLMEEKRTLESRNSLLERVVQLKQDTCTETVRRGRLGPGGLALSDSSLAAGASSSLGSQRLTWLLACRGRRDRFAWLH